MSFWVMLLCAASTFAESDKEIVKKIKLRGTPTYMKVDIFKTKKITFWANSPGNMSSYLDIYGRIPDGAVIKAEAVYVQKTSEDALSKKKNHYEIDLKNLKELLKEHSQCLPISVEEFLAGEGPENYPAITDPACDEIGDESLGILAESLAQAYGGEWSIGNACAYFISNAGDISQPDVSELCANYDHIELAALGIECPSDGGLFSTGKAALISDKHTRSASIQYTHLFGILKKDACLTEKNQEYLAMITVDLSKLNPLLYPDGVEFSISAKEFKLPKGKEAALKPESEGRYAPKPIILMNWLGDTCGNKIDVVSWKKYKPASITPLNIYALLSYKNMVLALALVDRVLTGGRATFDFSTRRESYGVCFNLQRKRQNKNGYPK